MLISLNPRIGYSFQWERYRFTLGQGVLLAYVPGSGASLRGAELVLGVGSAF
ncbi:MAG: hypothetical protein ACT4TC_20290 [Myxococcaceae bacterium]